MKVNVQAVVDMSVRQRLEELAKREKITLSKYVARVLRDHLANEVPQDPTDTENTVGQYDESDLTEEDLAQFRRALKFDPKLTIESYLKWKNA